MLSKKKKQWLQLLPVVQWAATWAQSRRISREAYQRSAVRFQERAALKTGNSISATRLWHLAKSLIAAAGEFKHSQRGF